MNNQSRLHPHYTLPGVMHYLQTEFTKNERDRITWELERAEMKARIAQLEGENKDLRYKLMKLNMQTSGTAKEADTKDVSGNDLSELLKSKMAVQESVKEIIYLFKSPEIPSRIGSLNEERDSLHEIQKLNLNQDLHSMKKEEASMSHLLQANLHPAGIQPQAVYAGDLNSRDANSDAATVVLGSDTEGSESHDTRRRRSSSLFSSTNVAPMDATKDEIGHFKEPAKISSLFQSNGNGKSESAAIRQLKALDNQIISYSENGRIELWKIDSQLQIGERPDKTFDVVSSSFLDFYWLDARRFLVFDHEGVKLYATRSTSPLDSKEVFKELDFNIANAAEHDFINNRFLFVSTRTIQLLEVSASATSPADGLSMGRSYTIDGEREVISARFGMTEKSLIVLYSDPYELVIYNYQGKVLQRVEISKQLLTTDKIRPSLILNKKSSKLLIALGNRILVYSFDKRKVILNETLKTQPTNIVFKTVRNSMLFGYEDGTVEVRRLNDFTSILRVPVEEHEEATNGKKVTHLDCTSVNSATLIVFGFDDGTIKVQRNPDLLDS
ncbi:hypothetical protein HG536_0G01030 [Torulaspora globosa]|uniref:Striatin N-terminal domain-containing protein n=1 Tax=Torulaspora globosa TaxID=48254 RepID=A0A7G3ZL60_9SACH|nr:uncharacterized protein HG536_0G01030 [Torulaspora globosa]QLL34246.1 hypothetical protein HG536_0G01030 [Torulaspora globosa]